MDVPAPTQAVAALAGFVRDRLADVSATIGPLLGRGTGMDLVALTAHDRAPIEHVRRLAGVIVGAAAPFAPTSYSRARLIRQMHASGLLSDTEVRRAAAVLELDVVAPVADPGSGGRGAPPARPARDNTHSHRPC